ncbi:hypothetical protein BpHYR1_038282 [Brachionus plicatilis]|uniref:Uncharacterized protein n=1 Tax=Brachionus plicatilis TaxID=10195 RepID=A0A3M7PZJ8_BRAPC|nr:hypothetical protein BpHYR1_038282 [Brachionus plicatilis]
MSKRTIRKRSAGHRYFQDRRQLMNGLLPFISLIFAQNKINSHKTHFIVKDVENNIVLGGGQLWPAGLRPDLNGHLAGQFKRQILAVNLTAAF